MAKVSQDIEYVILIIALILDTRILNSECLQTLKSEDPMIKKTASEFHHFL